MSGADNDTLGFLEARQAILSHCPTSPTETVAISDTLGRALAEDIRSPVNHPPWDNSAMDGYAVRAEDVRGASVKRPVRLPISDDVPAGGFPAGPLEPGTAARVMTGAPVPAGASGVVRIEHTDAGWPDVVQVTRDSDAERNVRRAGEDVRAQQVVLTAGSELTPAAIGVLATGDEIVDFDRVEEVLAGRRIMNSNSYSLAAQLRDAGADAVMLGIASDDPAAVRNRIAAAADCDAVISTAGISVGEHDHVRDALAALGATQVFWRARIRPGGPIALSMLGERPVWSLPGNPVSAMVTFEVFLRPAIRKMAGHSTLFPRIVRGRSRAALSSVARLTHFLRVTIEADEIGAPRIALTGPQGSGILTSMSLADGLAIVPEGIAEVPAGALVDVIPVGR